MGQLSCLCCTHIHTYMHTKREGERHRDRSKHRGNSNSSWCDCFGLAPPPLLHACSGAILALRGKAMGMRETKEKMMDSEK